MTNTQLAVRTHFNESMHNDFFTVNGLQSSTGQTSRDFGNVVLSEGFATVAIRDLLERAQTCENMTIFALHDADPAGYIVRRGAGQNVKVL